MAFHIIKIATTTAALSVMVGCAGVKFVRTSAEAFQNGRTTSAQVVEKMGKPLREGSITKNDKNIKTYSYAYASSGGASLNPGVTAARSMGFYFYNDILVGHEFCSSWAEDHTDFDETKISSISKGKSTRAEVERLLGKAGGYYTYPLTKSTDEVASVYLFSETRGSAFNLKFYSKTFAVYFDASGVVTNVEFVSNGSK